MLDRTRGRWVGALLAVLASSLVQLTSHEAAAEVAAPPEINTDFDLVIAGGRVIDPESGLDAMRWVGVRDGTIVAVSKAALAGTQTIDATGSIVAPGFIDLHVHGQDPESYDYMAADGVTTALDLEAGVTHVEKFRAARRRKARIHFGASAGHLPARARIFDGVAVSHFLTARQMENGPGLWWLGLRLMLFGQPTYGHAKSDPSTRAKILDALSDELDAGAIGVGMGLAYAPGADEDEIRAVLALAAERRVPAFVHLANRESVDDLRPILSLLEQARATKAAVHVVHVNSSGGRRVADYLAAIEAARAGGMDVSVEAYPYTASSTLIESAIYDEGWREKSGGDYGDLQWAETGERLTATTFAKYRTQGGTVINHGMRDEDVALAITHPLVMIGSDGMPMEGKAPHPRGAGSHARVLGRYVRELGLIDLSTAIRKLSLDPARRLESFVPGMREKGRVQVGADADLVVFDAKTVIDRATFENPYQRSGGISHVLVGGTLVVRDGELVPDAAPGQAVRASLGR